MRRNSGIARPICTAANQLSGQALKSDKGRILDGDKPMGKTVDFTSTVTVKTHEWLGILEENKALRQRVQELEELIKNNAVAARSRKGVL